MSCNEAALDFRGAFRLRRALGSARRAMRVDARLLTIATLLVMIVDGSFVPSPFTIALLGASRSRDAAALDPATELAGSACCVLGVVLLFITLGAFVEVGYLRAQRVALLAHDLDRAAFSNSTILFVRMLGLAFVRHAVTLTGAVLGTVPGVSVGLFSKGSAPLEATAGVIALVGALGAFLYLELGFTISQRLVALEETTLLDAVRRSFRFAHGRRLGLFVFVVALRLLAAVGIVGVLIFGVGIFVTYPFARAHAELALTDAFLRCDLARLP